MPAARRRKPLRNKAHVSARRRPLPKQEYVNGQLKNKYGDAFIRGNNGARAHAPAGAPSSVPSRLDGMESLQRQRC